MQCPFCQSPLEPDAAECPACRLSYPRADRLLGSLLRLNPGVADTTGLLGAAGESRLRKRIAAIRRRFPQLVPQVVLNAFPAEHPFSLHAFWLFNAGKFAPDSQRGTGNHTLLVVLDPVRNEAAIVPGYGLEPSLEPAARQHLLELAGPAWEKQLWADGLIKLLDGLDRLLESVALPDGKEAPLGEF